MRFVALHGPNLNLLGTRMPEVYGSQTLDDVVAMLRAVVEGAGHEFDSFQSNHEGALVDRLQQERGRASGAVLNAGALSHTSYSLRDAIEAAGYPVVEVHLSNVFAREEFRRHSVLSEVCRGVVAGLGAQSYVAGMQALMVLVAPPTKPARAPRRARG